MQTIAPRIIACVAVLLTAGFGGVAHAQRSPSQTKNEDKARDKDKAKAERDAKRYDKLKKFALDKYESDTDFREQVDDHFDQVLRDHSQEAFRKNVAAPARPTVVNDGDRLRLQTGLYDNKLVSDYINRVGQFLVPPDSDKLFAFRLVAHPIPFAETLSTGTIYISTGLVSLLDNESQLAYVLAHEMAHVQLEHWKLKSTLFLAQEEFNSKESRKRTMIIAGLAALGGAATGAATGRDAAGVAQFAAVGGAAGLAVGSAWSNALALDWDTVQENDADDVAFKAVKRRNYDTREVPKLYALMQNAVRQDQRVGLAFMGNRRRTAERLATAEELVARSGPEADAAGAKPIVTQPEFVRMMSSLRRDNGIMSFYHDMFALARANLEYAQANRPNDPAAHYYYGKVMKLVARTDADRALADQAFRRAIEFDHRERNYGAHFYRALALIDQKNPALNQEITRELQAYLIASMRFASEDASIANALPANLDDMYDYLTEAGELRWQIAVPDGMRRGLIDVGTQLEKPESPASRAPVSTRPASAPPPRVPPPTTPTAPAPPKKKGGGGQ